MNMHRRILLPTVFCILLTACGQKGPLYLPGDPNDVRSSVPPTANSSGGTETEADEESDNDDQPPRTP